MTIIMHNKIASRSISAAVVVTAKQLVGDEHCNMELDYKLVVENFRRDAHSASLSAADPALALIADDIIVILLLLEHLDIRRYSTRCSRACSCSVSARRRR